MEHQSIAPAAHSESAHADASQAPGTTLLQGPRWTLLRRIRAHQRNEHVDDHANEEHDVEPQLVGVRDQASGQTRIFTVYRSPSSVPSGTEPPPDPDPPPASPARARPPVERRDFDEADPGMWPHALAA